MIYLATDPPEGSSTAVAANTKLSDTWTWQTNASTSLAYDLTVIGPNGFLRRFTSAGSITATQTATACYEITQGDLSLNLSNAGTAPSTFTITDNRYGVPPQTFTVAAGQTVQAAWNLASSKRWYDISVTSGTDAHFMRQFAGYVETGAAGVTDPSMA